MPTKCILILLDGIGDRACEKLKGKTPLQAARTPALDKLSEKGSNGLYHAALPGQALPSENAHFIMFGYDISEFPGRGALEALGMDMELSKEEVAVLSHFVSIRESENTLILEDGKPSAQDKEIAELTAEIDRFQIQGLKIRFVPAGGIRGIVTLQGDVSRFITDSDPFINGRPLINILPWDEYRNDRASVRTANALKTYLLHSYKKLNAHRINRSRIKNGHLPLNGLVTQRSGQLKKPTPFTEKYGLRGLTIASGNVYWGLGKYLGLDVQKVQDTKNPGRDMSRRIQLACDALNDYDFIHIHTKAPDEAGHNKDSQLKKSVIESLDRGIAEAIDPLMNNPEILIVVTADHSTPSSGPLVHSGESVPILFYGRGVRKDSVRRFDEVSASPGALGNMRGRELIYMILNHLDRSKLFGIMDTPVDQPYWPGEYETLKLK
ncbi:MAG: alkaline phosphatase family protein [Desulfobacterales bacterium]